MTKESKKQSQSGKNSLLWLIVFLCAIVFIILCIKILKQETISFDLSFYNFLSKFISTPFTFLALFITEFGDLYILTSITLLIIFFSRNKHAKILVPLNFITIIFFNQLIKYIVQRPRPDIFQLTHASGFSFPSGHSMTSIAFYG